MQCPESREETSTTGGCAPPGYKVHPKCGWVWHRPPPRWKSSTREEVHEGDTCYPSCHLPDDRAGGGPAIQPQLRLRLGRWPPYLPVALRRRWRIRPLCG